MSQNIFRLNVLTRSALLIFFSFSAIFSYSQTEKLSHSLDYINEQFKKHNSYNLQFHLDTERKNLISRSIYFEVTYPIKQLHSIYYTERGEKDCIIFFKCQNDDQCISSLNLNDSITNLKSEYSFNLETSPEIAEKVVMEFFTIKNGVNNINNSAIAIPEASNFDLNSDIEFINKMLKKHNSFNIQFSIDWKRKLLQSSSTYFEITYDPSTLNTIELISRGENDYKINFKCKLDENCLKSVDLHDNKIELKNNYPVNFSGKAEEAQKMIDTFNQILENLR